MEGSVVKNEELSQAKRRKSLAAEKKDVQEENTIKTEPLDHVKLRRNQNWGKSLCRLVKEEIEKKEEIQGDKEEELGDAENNDPVKDEKFSEAEEDYDSSIECKKETMSLRSAEEVDISDDEPFIECKVENHALAEPCEYDGYG